MRFFSTNRRSRGSMVLPHTAQIAAFGFLKNIGFLPLWGVYSFDAATPTLVGRPRSSATQPGPDQHERVDHLGAQLAEAGSRRGLWMQIVGNRDVCRMTGLTLSRSRSSMNASQR